MEVEKRSSKGGFLQLFDWNLKSRKKLFPNKSELSENLKQGKENVDGSAISQLQQVHVYGQSPCTWGDSDLHYHCAPSLIADDRYGTKVPGVVARLMGLDSLPTSNVSEPFKSPYFESQSFRDSYYFRKPMDYPNEHHIVVYESMRHKLDALARNPLELTSQKVQRRPIERFQTEVLPLKSVKPMSVTQNKLFSPIKSPGFIPPKNAAYIIEAAARMVEQSPRSTVKGKIQSYGSPAVPLKIRDFKEKVNAAQKVSKITEASKNSSKHLIRNPLEKQDVSQFRVSQAAKVDQQSMNKKPVSLAVKAKSNVQKRDGLNSMSRRSINQSQHFENRPSSISKNNGNTRKNTERRTPSSRSSGVLRQNNQKQNCMSNKERESLKTSGCNQYDRKVSSTSDVTKVIKAVNKIITNTPVGSGKTYPTAVHSGEGLRESRVKQFSGKRRPVSADNNSSRSAVSNALMSKEERSVKCNISIEGRTNSNTIDRKSSGGVVSFTFTSPIKRSLTEPHSAKAIANKKNIHLITCPGENETNSTYSTATSSGFNVVKDDAITGSLEQKLKELASRVEFSDQDLVEVDSLPSSNNLHDAVSTFNSMNAASLHAKGLQNYLPEDKSEDGCDSNCSTFYEVEFGPAQNWKRRGEMEAHSGINNIDCERDFVFRYSRPASSLEPSLSESSCNSLDSNEVSGSKWCISMESYEVSDLMSARTSHLVDGDPDLADSASSASVWTIRGNTTTILRSTGFNGLCHWEMEYIRDIIKDADLMFEEFACHQVHQILEPNLFDQLESRITESSRNLEAPLKVARKALFDCVEECLELRCKRIFCGSFIAWAKWTSVYWSTGRLAEDMYREILGWTNMVDLMVDEVVDKDMSSQSGRWVEFEAETFEAGIDIEMELLASLLDEVVDDFLSL